MRRQNKSKFFLTADIQVNFCNRETLAIKVKVCELLIIRQKKENTHFVRTLDIPKIYQNDYRCLLDKCTIVTVLRRYQSIYYTILTVCFRVAPEGLCFTVCEKLFFKL